MKAIILLVLLTTCGTAGEMFTDAGKCISSGSECHPTPVPGPTGAPGRDGTNGKDGKNGESCTVERVSNGAIITCPGAESVVILNGTDGANGQDGEDGQDAPATAYTVVELIDPCGAQPGFNEVLLRMANGQLIAHYAQGNKQFLAVIGPGNYMTTDGHSCYFTIDSNNIVTW